jgi:hypothetical protein
VDWIQLAQVSYQQAKELSFPIKGGEFLKHLIDYREP